MQNIKFKTCIIDGQERYAFATIDENGQMTEMPAQMFPESLLSFMDIDMSRVSELFSAMNDCIISLPDIADTKYLDKLLYILEALSKTISLQRQIFQVICTSPRPTRILSISASTTVSLSSMSILSQSFIYPLMVSMFRFPYISADI